jgi:hypothetical protein
MQEGSAISIIPFIADKAERRLDALIDRASVLATLRSIENTT